MGTIPHKFETDLSKRIYRRHTAEFKQSVVEQSYAPGASVARLAQQHQINANQIFAWRKLARDQHARTQSGSEHGAVLLPVTIADEAVEDATASKMISATHAQSIGSIEVTIGAARIVIHGRADSLTLRAVLAQLLR